MVFTPCYVLDKMKTDDEFFTLGGMSRRGFNNFKPGKTQTRTNSHKKLKLKVSKG